MHTHHSDTHQSHPAIVKRLRRAGGHLNSIVEMIEQGRSCLDIAQQGDSAGEEDAHSGPP